MTAPPQQLLGPNGHPLGPDGEIRYPARGVSGQQLLGEDGAPILLAAAPGGAPYPLPTDPVANGAANIQALATFVDPAEVCLFRPEALNCPSSSWTAVGWTQTLWVIGSGVHAGNGVTVDYPGRYRVEAFGQFPSNPTGRRGIAISSGPVSSGSPTDLRPAAASGSNVLAIATTVNMAAAGSINLYMYQESGATINCSICRINVYRAP